MDKHRRLKTIELSLTPQQVVLLWMSKVLKGKYEDAARQSPPARSAIANSILHTVTSSLKGQPEEVIEQAVLQARQEADLLYLLVVHVNAAVQQGFMQRGREYLFLFGYPAALLGDRAAFDLEPLFRELTLMFVEDILCLDEAVSQLSIEKFNGQCVLFSDSAEKLKEQQGLAEKTLEHFNLVAQHLQVPELRMETIRTEIRLHADRQVDSWVIMSSGLMFSLFGGGRGFCASIDELIQLYKEPIA